MGSYLSTMPQEVGGVFHLNDICPDHLTFSATRRLLSLSTHEPVLDLFVPAECLGDIESRQIPPKECSNLRNIGFDHFSESRCLSVIWDSIEANLASDSGGPRQRGKADIDEFGRIEVAVEIAEISPPQELAE